MKKPSILKVRKIPDVIVCLRRRRLDRLVVFGRDLLFRISGAAGLLGRQACADRTSGCKAENSTGPDVEAGIVGLSTIQLAALRAYGARHACAGSCSAVAVECINDSLAPATGEPTN
jgi:hypothetical protein